MTLRHGSRLGLLALLACAAACNVYTSDLLRDAEGGTSSGGSTARGGATAEGGEAAGGVSGGGMTPGGAAGAGGGVQVAGAGAVAGSAGSSAGTGGETLAGGGGGETEAGGSAGHGGGAAGGENGGTSGAGGSAGMAGEGGSAGRAEVSGAGGTAGVAESGGAPPSAGTAGAVATGGRTGQGGTGASSAGGTTSTGGVPVTGGAPTGGAEPTPTCSRTVTCTARGGPAGDLLIGNFDAAVEPTRILGSDRVGYWYVYNSQAAGILGGSQLPTLGAQLPVAPGADSTPYAAYTSGSLFPINGGYAGLGINLNDPGAGYVCPYDASMYAGIQFAIKGTVSGNVRLKLQISDTVPTTRGGTCCVGTQCDDDFRKDFAITSQWQTLSFRWEEFATDPFWGNIVYWNAATLMGLQWQVTGDAANAPFEIWLDSVQFVAP